MKIRNFYLILSCLGFFLTSYSSSTEERRDKGTVAFIKTTRSISKLLLKPLTKELNSLKDGDASFLNKKMSAFSSQTVDNMRTAINEELLAFYDTLVSSEFQYVSEKTRRSFIPYLEHIAQICDTSLEKLLNEREGDLSGISGFTNFSPSKRPLLDTEVRRLSKRYKQLKNEKIKNLTTPELRDYADCLMLAIDAIPEIVYLYQRSLLLISYQLREALTPLILDLFKIVSIEPRRLNEVYKLVLNNSEEKTPGKLTPPPLPPRPESAPAVSEKNLLEEVKGGVTLRPTQTVPAKKYDSGNAFSKELEERIKQKGNLKPAQDRQLKPRPDTRTTRDKMLDDIRVGRKLRPLPSIPPKKSQPVSSETGSEDASDESVISVTPQAPPLPPRPSKKTGNIKIQPIEAGSEDTGVEDASSNDATEETSIPTPPPLPDLSKKRPEPISIKKDAEALSEEQTVSVIPQAPPLPPRPSQEVGKPKNIKVQPVESDNEEAGVNDASLSDAAEESTIPAPPPLPPVPFASGAAPRKPVLDNEFAPGQEVEAENTIQSRELEEIKKDLPLKAPGRVEKPKPSNDNDIDKTLSEALRQRANSLQDEEDEVEQVESAAASAPEILEARKAGISAENISNSAMPVSSKEREGLLEDIRKGKKLKPTQPIEKQKPSEAIEKNNSVDASSIGEALAEQINKKAKFLPTEAPSEEEINSEWLD